MCVKNDLCCIYWPARSLIKKQHQQGIELNLAQHFAFFYIWLTVCFVLNLATCILFYYFPVVNFPFHLLCPFTQQVLHYVEKPETFVSEIINCGIYIFSPAALFKLMGEVIQKNYRKMRYVPKYCDCLSFTKKFWKLLWCKMVTKGYFGLSEWMKNFQTKQNIFSDLKFQGLPAVKLQCSKLHSFKNFGF